LRRRRRRRIEEEEAYPPSSVKFEVRSVKVLELLQEQLVQRS
jgi:hypothetical protein